MFPTGLVATLVATGASGAVAFVKSSSILLAASRFDSLVNLLVDVLREPDVRQFSAITFSATPWAPRSETQACCKSRNRCFGSFAAVTSELNPFSILLSSGVPMVLVNTWPVSSSGSRRKRYVLAADKTVAGARLT